MRAVAFNRAYPCEYTLYLRRHIHDTGGPPVDPNIQNIVLGPASWVQLSSRFFFFSARELLRVRPDGDLTAHRYDKL